MNILKEKIKEASLSIIPIVEIQKIFLTIEFFPPFLLMDQFISLCIML